MSIREKPIGIQLEQAPVPFHLSRRENAKVATEASENILISNLEKRRYEGILKLLNHPELNTAAQEGIFTVGIIKPQAYKGKDLPEEDEKATQVLYREIVGRGFNVVFAVSLQLTRDQAEKFYGEHRDKPFFDSLMDFTVSGPMTFLLIQDRSGKAVSKWRHEIGSTKAPPDEKVQAIETSHRQSPVDAKLKTPFPPGHPTNLTLRAQFRNPDVEASNNIFHGSDSPESAAREIGILREYIRDVYENLDGDKPGFPAEEDIFDSGLLNPDTDQLISVERQPGEESYEHVVRARTPKGEQVLFYPGKVA